MERYLPLRFMPPRHFGLSGPRRSRRSPLRVAILFRIEVVPYVSIRLKLTLHPLSLRCRGVILDPDYRFQIETESLEFTGIVAANLTLSWFLRCLSFAHRHESFLVFN